METLTAKIEQYITEFNPTLDMMDEECYVMPAYTSDSPEVQAACDEMNAVSQGQHHLSDGRRCIVVDKQLISGWVTYDAEMKVAFNEDAVQRVDAGVRQKSMIRWELPERSRRRRERLRKCPAEHTAGSVDEAAETENLINSIKNGEVADGAPAYKQTGGFPRRAGLGEHLH